MLEIRGGCAAQLGSLGEYVRKRRKNGRILGGAVGLQKKILGGNLPNELAIIYRVIVQDSGADGYETIQRGNVGDESIGTREAVKKERGDATGKRLAGGYDLSPTLGAVEDNGATEVGGDSQLHLKDLAHTRRDLSIVEAVEADFADAKVRRFLNCRADGEDGRIIRGFGVPRVNADEVPANQEFPIADIGTDVAMGVGHFLPETP